MDEQLASAHDFALERKGPTSYCLTGTVTAPTSGWGVDIHPMSDGIVPDPTVARFLVHAIAPPPGEVTLPVLTPHAIEETFEDAAELERVVIHLQGALAADGATDIELKLD